MIYILICMKKNTMHQTTYAGLYVGRSDVVIKLNNNNNKNSNKTYNLTTFQWKSKWYGYMTKVFFANETPIYAMWK